MRQEALASLMDLSRAGRMPQSVLLYGPAAPGVEQAASELLGSLFCASTSGHPCGQCADCRALANGDHPEVFAVGDGQTGEAIRIDVVREAIEHLGWHSSVRADGRPSWRVVWLRQAENLTEQAANALLKTLEEPPGGALLLLTSRHPRNLLPTLRSRLLAIRIPGRESAIEMTDEIRSNVRDLLTAREFLGRLGASRETRAAGAHETRGVRGVRRNDAQ